MVLCSCVCVSARACREWGWGEPERERKRSLNDSKLQELAIEYLWLYPFVHFYYAWCFTWYALEMQYLHLKTKTRLPTGASFASSFVWAIWRAGSYMHWQGWTEMGHRFSWKCGSVNFLLLCIWKNLSTSTLKSNRIIMRWTMTQHMQGVMQGEGMLDKIGIVRCMILS